MAVVVYSGAGKRPILPSANARSRPTTALLKLAASNGAAPAHHPSRGSRQAPTAQGPRRAGSHGRERGQSAALSGAGHPFRGPAPQHGPRSGRRVHPYCGTAKGERIYLTRNKGKALFCLPYPNASTIFVIRKVRKQDVGNLSFFWYNHYDVFP